MELLPRSPGEFGSARYWERFFRQRGQRPFEWYGAFPELCPVLHKYVRPRDKVSPEWNPAPCSRAEPPPRWAAPAPQNCAAVARLKLPSCIDTGDAKP